MVKFIGFLLFVVVLVDYGQPCCIYHPNCDHPKLMARMDQLEKKIDKLMEIAGNCSAGTVNEIRLSFKLFFYGLYGYNIASVCAVSPHKVEAKPDS